MKKELKQNVLFIQAGDGFIPDGIRGEGFLVEKPYYEKGLFLRLVREAWFRAHLPFKELFYNKRVLAFEGEYLFVRDPQITRAYLQWLQKQRKWKLFFIYDNMVGRARHIYPNQIPEGIDVWTYDRSDSEKYGIKLNDRMSYYVSFCKEKQEPEYDVLYVGRDKGRGEFLYALEKALNEAGLRTFFRVVGDTRFEKKKDKRYGPEMSYDEICELIARSKAILNVILPGQEGMTVRDSEAICNNVKLITTNATIVDRPIYRSSNMLVIQGIEVDRIKEFLEVPYEPYGENVKEDFLLEKWIGVLLEGKK